MFEIKYGVYCSGNAGRICCYLDDKLTTQYPDCIVHDGEESEKLILLAKRFDIEYKHVELPKLTGREAGRVLSDILLETLKKYHVDYCICFGSRILSGELLDQYSNKIINFHPSVLPMFPGVKAIDKALEANSPLLGNTAHFIDSGIDTGPIIMQSLLHRNNYNDYNDVLDMQIPMLRQILCWLNEKRIIVLDRKAYVDKASYGIDKFIPNLETVF